MAVELVSLMGQGPFPGASAGATPAKNAALFPELADDPQALEWRLHGSFKDLEGPDGFYAYDQAGERVYKVDDLVLGLEEVGRVVKVKKTRNLAGMAAGVEEELMVVDENGRRKGTIEGNAYYPE